MEKIRIKQATKQGYAEVGAYGAFDMSYPDSDTRRGRVQDDGEVSPTITAQSMEIGVVEPVICALRGRNPDRPTDRTAGLPTQQMLEIKDDGTSNTLTTVKKDNLLCEPVIFDDYNQRIKADQSCINTLTTNCGNDAERNVVKLIENYRIRKLTERECWRLMGFSDADFDKAANVNSRSQLYKQAGNSIVVNVLMEIFRRML